MRETPRHWLTACTIFTLTLNCKTVLHLFHGTYTSRSTPACFTARQRKCRLAEDKQWTHTGNAALCTHQEAGERITVLGSHHSATQDTQAPNTPCELKQSAYPTAPPPCQTILRRQLNHRAHASKTRYTSVMDRVHFFSAHILDSPLPTAVARAGSSAQRTQLCCRNSARQVCRALVKANGRSMSKAAPIPKAPACMTRGCPASADARGATTHEYTAQPARCTQSMYNLLATHVKA